MTILERQVLKKIRIRFRAIAASNLEVPSAFKKKKKILSVYCRELLKRRNGIIETRYLFSVSVFFVTNLFYNFNSLSFFLLIIFNRMTNKMYNLRHRLDNCIFYTLNICDKIGSIYVHANCPSR